MPGRSGQQQAVWLCGCRTPTAARRGAQVCRQSMPECSANATGKAAPLLGAAPLPGAAPFCQVQPMAGPLAAAGGSLCGASHCHALERRPPLELKAQLEAGALLATHNPLVRLAAAGKRERGAAGAAGAKCVRGSSSRHWHAVGRARAISPPLPNSAPACPSLKRPCRDVQGKCK